MAIVKESCLYKYKKSKYYKYQTQLVITDNYGHFKHIITPLPHMPILYLNFPPGVAKSIIFSLDR